METSIVFSGFGGQGALFAGQMLAYAAMESEKQVTWIPSYGPEMRGGTANCTVVIGEEPIASPLVRNPDCVVAMNQPSADKYEPLVKAGGLLLVNAELVQRPIERDDIQTVPVPGSSLAAQAGEAHLVNMVMLGALVRLTGVVTVAALEQALDRHLPPRHRNLLEENRRALQEGFAFAGTLDSAQVRGQTVGAGMQ